MSNAFVPGPLGFGLLVGSPVLGATDLGAMGTIVDTHPEKGFKVYWAALTMGVVHGPRTSPEPPRGYRMRARRLGAVPENRAPARLHASCPSDLSVEERSSGQHTPPHLRRSP